MSVDDAAVQDRPAVTDLSPEDAPFSAADDHSEEWSQSRLAEPDHVDNYGAVTYTRPISSAVIGEESPPMADPSRGIEDMKSKEANGDARDDALTGHGSLRSTSSKIANLRAAFEKGTHADSPVKRRFSNANKKRDQSTEREREYWKEIARLRDERDKEQELRQAYEDKCTLMEEEVEDLQERLKRDSNGPAHGKALHAEKTRMDEISSLQQQLLDLKRSISTSTRTDSQVSDSTFAQEMGVLHHELQNWIVNNFRRAKVDVSAEALCSRLEGLAELKHADLLKQLYGTFDAAAKLATCQAIAAIFLTDIFREPLLFGLPVEQAWVGCTVLAIESLRDVLTPVPYNRWRAATLDAIRQSETFQNAVQHASMNVVESLSSTLSKLTETDVNETGRTSLQSIVRRAVTLANLLRVQLARYDFYLPKPTDSFDAGMMEDISEGSDAGPECAVRCATFPAVVKIGDEHGDNIPLRNVILKAKVLCKEPVP